MADNPLHDHPRSKSEPKKYGEMLSKEEQDRPFKKKPNKKVDGYEFEHVDERKEDAAVVLDSLPKYKKDHYDAGGDYMHTDTDPETGEKSLWRKVEDEKPNS